MSIEKTNAILSNNTPAIITLRRNNEKLREIIKEYEMDMCILKEQLEGSRA